MANRSPPAFGSTAWGAEQFTRMLRREAAERALRERLLSEGWKPSGSPRTPFADAKIFNDERNQVADFVQAGIDKQRAIAEEARGADGRTA